LPFSKVRIACSETPKCSANAVTLTCAGFTISVFNQSSTWTASEGYILSAMIILKIQIDQCASSFKPKVIRQFLVTVIDQLSVSSCKPKLNPPGRKLVRTDNRASLHKCAAAAR
jgi:hypothetical protein